MDFRGITVALLSILHKPFNILRSLLEHPKDKEPLRNPGVVNDIIMTSRDYISEPVRTRD